MQMGWANELIFRRFMGRNASIYTALYQEV